MPIVRITVTAVSDEGDNVIVWGRPEHAPSEGEPIGQRYERFTSSGTGSTTSLST